MRPPHARFGSGRRLRGPPQVVSGGVEDLFEGQVAVLGSLLSAATWEVEA